MKPKLNENALKSSLISLSILLKTLRAPEKAHKPHKQKSWTCEGEAALERLGSSE